MGNMVTEIGGKRIRQARSNCNVALLLFLHFSVAGISSFPILGSAVYNKQRVTTSTLPVHHRLPIASDVVVSAPPRHAVRDILGEKSEANGSIVGSVRALLRFVVVVWLASGLILIASRIRWQTDFLPLKCELRRQIVSRD